MGKLTFWIVVTALLGVSAGPVGAQEAEPAPAAGPSQEVLQMWNYVGGKLVTMAEDFPEDKYDYRPTPEVRTFAEMLLHIAGTNYFFIHTAQGKPLGGEDLSRENYPAKAEVVAILKKSVEEGAALILQAGDEGMAQPIKFPFGNQMISQQGFWMGPVEHAGEHYGNLVVYYRLNGIVPPASRGSN